MRNSSHTEQTSEIINTLEELLTPPNGDKSKLRYTADGIKRIIDCLRNLPESTGLELEIGELPIVIFLNRYSLIESPEPAVIETYNKIWTQARSRILRDITKQEGIAGLPEDEKELNPRYLHAKKLQKPSLFFCESLKQDARIWNGGITPAAKLSITSIFTHSQAAFEWVIAHELGHFFDPKGRLSTYDKEATHATIRAEENAADRYANCFVDPIQGVIAFQFLEDVHDEILVIKDALTKYIPDIDTVFKPLEPNWRDVKRRQEHHKIAQSSSPDHVKAREHSKAEKTDTHTHPSHYSRQKDALQMWHLRIKTEYPHNPLGGIGRP